MLCNSSCSSLNLRSFYQCNINVLLTCLCLIWIRKKKHEMNAKFTYPKFTFMQPKLRFKRQKCKIASHINTPKGISFWLIVKQLQWLRLNKCSHQRYVKQLDLSSEEEVLERNTRESEVLNVRSNEVMKSCKSIHNSALNSMFSL